MSITANSYDMLNEIQEIIPTLVIEEKFDKFIRGTLKYINLKLTKNQRLSELKAIFLPNESQFVVAEKEVVNG